MEPTSKKCAELNNKIKVVLYPHDQQTFDEILSNDCPIFKDETKRSLAANQPEIIISNISLDNINHSQNVKEQLQSLGLLRFSLVSNKHSSEKNLVKATCLNEATKIKLLKTDIEIPLGEHIKTLYTEPVFKGILQCQKCKVFGHHVSNCPANDEICGKCNNIKHVETNCPAISNCKNCTETHSSYDRK